MTLFSDREVTDQRSLLHPLIPEDYVCAQHTPQQVFAFLPFLTKNNGMCHYWPLVTKNSGLCHERPFLTNISGICH